MRDERVLALLELSGPLSGRQLAGSPKARWPTVSKMQCVGDWR
jgi:hypothetical protein